MLRLVRACTWECTKCAAVRVNGANLHQGVGRHVPGTWRCLFGAQIRERSRAVRNRAHIPLGCTHAEGGGSQFLGFSCITWLCKQLSSGRTDAAEHQVRHRYTVQTHATACAKALRDRVRGVVAVSAEAKAGRHGTRCGGGTHHVQRCANLTGEPQHCGDCAAHERRPRDSSVDCKGNRGDRS